MPLVISRQSVISATGLLVLLGLGNILGQTPAVRYAVVQGAVTNAKSRETVPRAQIFLTSDAGASFSAISDDQGHFTFERVPLGRYRIEITQQGFVSYRSGPLEADEIGISLRFGLTPATVLVGRVTNEDGAPQVGIRVAAVRPVYEDGKRALSFCGTADPVITDDRGNYRLYGLEPGRYYIVLFPIGCDAAAQFYPGVTDPADAISVALSGGTMPLPDMRMRREKTYTIRFKAVDPVFTYQNAFLAAARVVIHDGSSDLYVRTMELGSYSANFRKRPDGYYEISGLPRGKYTVYYGADVLFGNMARFDVQIEDRDVEVGTIVPLSLVKGLTGKISGPRSSLANLRVRLHAANGPWPPTHTRSNVSTPVNDAEFIFANVPGQRYFIELTGLPADAYLASARYAAQDVLEQGVSLENKPIGPIELEVRATGGSVEGAVSDSTGKRFQKGIVALIPTGVRRMNPLLFRTSAIRTDGNYSIRGVLPGEYEILAWEDLVPGAWMNETVLQSFSTRSVRLAVREGLPRKLDIKGISSEILQTQ